MASSTSATDQALYEEAGKFLKLFHETSDTLNLAKYTALYSNDVNFRAGNAPEIHGLENLVAFFGSMGALVGSSKHTLLHYHVHDGSIYQSVSADYVVKGDPERQVVTIPEFARFDRDAEGKIKKFQGWFDGSPLMERIGAVAQMNAGKM